MIHAEGLIIVDYSSLDTFAEILSLDPLKLQPITVNYNDYDDKQFDCSQLLAIKKNDLTQNVNERFSSKAFLG